MNLEVQTELARVTAGVIGAGLAAAGSFFAQLLPPQIEPWGQGGAILLLIGCLIYAIRHLAADAKAERIKREQDAARWEAKWAEEHEQNLLAREADRVTRERFAAAVEDLASKIQAIKE